MTEQPTCSKELKTLSPLTQHPPSPTPSDLQPLCQGARSEKARKLLEATVAPGAILTVILDDRPDVSVSPLRGLGSRVRVPKGS